MLDDDTVLLARERMRRVNQVLILIAAIGVPGGVGAQRDASAHVRNRAGCYALALGPWSGPLPNGSPAPHTPPAQCRLDTLALQTNPRPRFVVEPARLVPGHMVASWALLPNDSISMFWSTGFVGVSLRLGVRGDSLVGIATTFHDGHFLGEPPDPSASAVATRIACASG